jgi:cytochrome P450
VILSLLGLPEEDYPKMLQLTQQIFGPTDSDTARGATPDELAETVAEFFEYFARLVTDRQAHPRDDLASVIANARIDGVPLSPAEQLSYFLIIATAGHDTTSASIAGGIQALIENPEQLAVLQSDPTLVVTATEEIIRWVTPVKHFLRNAAAPYDLGGHHFEPGDCVLLSYWSANRDERVFVDPMRFDVRRNPNRHLAFGFGAHFCLGAALARMEIRAFLAELLPRLTAIEIAGPPRLTEAIFVSGLKSFEVNYSIT